MNDTARNVLAAARQIEHLVPSPWNRSAFLLELSRHRNRRLDLVAVDTPDFTDFACGLWLEFEDRDEIVYQRGAPDYQVDQTVLHEVGHMLLGHHGSVGHEPALAALLPDIDLITLTSVMNRSSFDDDQEGDAEMFADLVMSARVSRYRRSSAMDDFMGIS
ncbi:hypothetical protein [Rhodococcoides corynebacterioides]|uniref:hypothetical protein n=1 Tax=Rhodococcoides corynebacterioides TaxID=53972 RepID=UPI0021BE4C54|nr:hypothetical protein [Rhodococcus corynebacterioides]